MNIEMDNKPALETLKPFRNWLNETEYYISENDWRQFIDNDVNPKTFIGGLYCIWYGGIYQSPPPMNVNFDASAQNKCSGQGSIKDEDNTPLQFRPFRQWLIDRGLFDDLDEYLWESYVKGKASALSRLYKYYWQWEDEVYGHGLARIRKCNDAQKAIEIYDKMLDEKRCALQFARTPMQRSQISSAIYEILQERAHSVNEIREKQAALKAEEDEKKWENFRKVQAEEKAKWYYPIKRFVKPVAFSIAMIFVVTVSLFLAYHILIGSARIPCTILLMLWDAGLAMIGCGINDDNNVFYSEYKVCARNVLMTTATMGGIVVIFVPLGYIWYYICGGGALFVDGVDIWDFILGIPITVGLLLYLVLGVANLFKK